MEGDTDWIRGNGDVQLPLLVWAEGAQQKKKKKKEKKRSLIVQSRKRHLYLSCHSFCACVGEGGKWKGS
jgi:hypothetical protein